MPVERLPEFLAWFDARGRDAAGVAVPACATTPRPWPLVPARARTHLRQRRLLGHRARRPGRGRRRRSTARSRRRSRELGGHKSPVLRGVLRPRRPSTRSTTAPHLAARRRRSYDPDDRLTAPLRQGGATTMTQTARPTRTCPIAEALDSLLRDGMPLRLHGVRRQRGRPAGRADRGCDLRTERGLAYLLTAPGDLGHGARLRRRRPRLSTACTRATPTTLLVLLHEPPAASARPTPAEALALRARAGRRQPQAAAAAAAGGTCRAGGGRSRGCGTRMARDAEAISHHYDVSNRFYELVLGPSMTYTCAVFPTPDATLEEAQAEKYDLVARKLGLQPGQRLLDVGCGWGGMVRHAAREYGVSALGVTLSRQQAQWAQEAIDARGARRPRRGAAPRLPRRRRRPASTRSARSASPSTSACATTRRTSRFLRDRLRPGGRLLNHCITRPHNRRQDDRARSSTATSSPTAS